MPGLCPCYVTMSRSNTSAATQIFHLKSCYPHVRIYSSLNPSEANTFIILKESEILGMLKHRGQNLTGSIVAQLCRTIVFAAPEIQSNSPAPQWAPDL